MRGWELGPGIMSIAQRHLRSIASSSYAASVSEPGKIIGWGELTIEQGHDADRPGGVGGGAGFLVLKSRLSSLPKYLVQPIYLKTLSVCTLMTQPLRQTDPY